MSSRHGKHNKNTIAFRASAYEMKLIDEKVKASGMKKMDYIVRSCIYNRVCVVGKKENLEYLRDEAKEMCMLIEKTSRDLQSTSPAITENGLQEIMERYQAFLEAMLWMLKGSAYLWEDKNDESKGN